MVTWRIVDGDVEYFHVERNSYWAAPIYYRYISVFINKESIQVCISVRRSTRRIQIQLSQPNYAKDPKQNRNYISSGWSLKLNRNRQNKTRACRLIYSGPAVWTIISFLCWAGLDHRLRFCLLLLTERTFCFCCMF